MRKKSFLTGAVILAVLIAGCSEPTVEPSKEAVNGSEMAAEESVPENTTGTSEIEDDTEYAYAGDETSQMYLSFIEGNEKVDGLGIEEFLASVTNNPEDYYAGSPIKEVRYAVIDCGNDGNCELIMAIDCDLNPETLTRYFLIKEFEGKLSVTFTNISLPLQNVEFANRYGKVCKAGSVGMDFNYCSIGYINAGGEYELCYEETTSYGNTMVLDSRFEAALANADTDYSNTFLKSYVFSEDAYDRTDSDADAIMYCAQKVDDEESNGVDFEENEKLFNELFEDVGLTLHTPDEIRGNIAEKERDLGIDETIKSEAEITWEVYDKDGGFL